MNTYNYTFPAIRGIQAKREYYVAMCPLKLVPKILVFNEPTEIEAEFRAQRILNKSRIPLIVRYIIDNPKEYIFSALTVSVDQFVEFFPIEGVEGGDIGQIQIPMTANMVVNDGQHRRAAIEGALKLRPELGNETISIVFFLDPGLKRSQQMFADLNKYAIRPTKSLSILYDHRDILSNLVKEIIIATPVFEGMTEYEKTSISNRSKKLFTLNSLYQATKSLLRGKDLNNPSNFTIAIDFWTEIAKMIPDWEHAKTGKVTSSTLRKNFIHAHGIALHTLGLMGSSLLEQHPKGWKRKLLNLKQLDWSRSNSKLWENRAMVAGKISKTTNHVKLTANLLKQTVGLKLTDAEQNLEREMRKAK